MTDTAPNEPTSESINPITNLYDQIAKLSNDYKGNNDYQTKDVVRKAMAQAGITNIQSAQGLYGLAHLELQIWRRQENQPPERFNKPFPVINQTLRDMETTDRYLQWAGKINQGVSREIGKAHQLAKEENQDLIKRIVSSTRQSPEDAREAQLELNRKELDKMKALEPEARRNPQEFVDRITSNKN